MCENLGGKTMKKFLAILLAGMMLVAMFAVCSSADDNLCDMSDQDAVAAAQAKKEEMKSQYNVWDVSRRIMWQLKANQESDQVKQMEEYLKTWKSILDDDSKLYTADYYASFDGLLEGVFSMYRVKYGVNSGFAKSGWYAANINDSDSSYAVDRTVDKAYAVLNENSDLSDADKATLKAIGKYYVDDVLTNMQAWADLGFAKWMAQTSDIEGLTIQQIFNDMCGTGVQDDNTNEFEDAVENNTQYARCSAEVIGASVRQIEAKYKEMAQKFPALQSYADKYSAYVAANFAGAPTPPTPPTPDNPGTADIAIIALAVSSVASLAGAFIAKKSK